MRLVILKFATLAALWVCLSAFTTTSEKTHLMLDQLDELSWSNIPKALAKANDIENHLIKYPDINAQSRLFNIKGYTYLLTREHAKAYHYIHLAGQLAVEASNLREQAESKRLLASLYVVTNMQSESLAIFLDALSMHKMLNSDKIFDTLQGISLYYRSVAQFEKYLEYGNLLLSQPIAQDDNKQRGLAEYTVGEALLKLGKYNESKPHLLNSIHVLEKISSTWVSEAYVSLAELEFLAKDYQQALLTVTKSKSLAQRDKYYLASLQAELLTARIFEAQGDIDSAIGSLLVAIDAAELHADKTTEQQANLHLAELYEQQESFNAALIHFKKYQEATDELFKDTQETKSSFYHARLDLENKELQITQLENEKSLQALANKQREKTAKLRDAILALLFFILIFLIYYVVHAKRTKHQMKKLADEATLANQAKSNFLAKMSHEIRTPMNAIIGLSQLALNAKLSPKQRENISMVHSSSQSLLTLLNDILDFSKIEAKKLELEKADFLLNSSIQRLLNVCSFSADEKQLKLNIIVDNDVPTALSGDALRLEQILINLVNNAIKFTESGDITIHVSQISQTKNLNTLKFSVTDHGIGIGEEQLQRLFSAFSQADVSVTRRYGGSGLGLTICKELVELMNGKIEVESELGVGSCFSFIIEVANSNKLSSQLLKQDLSSLNHLKLLIVDDSKSSRTLLSETLVDLGLESAQARSGIEALEQIKEAIENNRPYDVVLMDWRMPGLDGLESIRIINQVVSKGLPKFILVSSFDKSDAVNLSRHLPIEDVLEKPIKPSQLTNSLLTITSSNSSTQSRISTPTPTTITKEDFSNKTILLAEDNTINQKVILGFLSDTGATIEIAENGIEALEMARTNAYDIILMDVQMPEMDGLSATTLIRKQLALDTPIVAMTAHSLPEDIKRSMDAGMNVHLTKPINANLLIETITKLT